MPARLSQKQREILGLVAACCEPVLVRIREEPRVVPFYIERTADAFFDSPSERQRFYERMKNRGLIRIVRGCFIYITDAGKAALASNTSVESPNDQHQVRP